MKLSQVLLAIAVFTSALGGVFVMSVAAQEDECNQDSDQTNDDSDFADAVANVLNVDILSGNSVTANVLGDSSSSEGGGDSGTNDNENNQDCEQSDSLLS